MIIMRLWMKTLCFVLDLTWFNSSFHSFSSHLIVKFTDGTGNKKHKHRRLRWWWARSFKFQWYHIFLTCQPSSDTRDCHNQHAFEQSHQTPVSQLIIHCVQQSAYHRPQTSLPRSYCISSICTSLLKDCNLCSILLTSRLYTAPWKLSCCHMHEQMASQCHHNTHLQHVISTESRLKFLLLRDTSLSWGRHVIHRQSVQIAW